MSKKTTGYYLGSTGRVKSKGNAIGGIALVLSSDLNFHSRVSIYRGTLVFLL